MTSEEGEDTLKIYWDHFFKAETGTYEKSTWLDLFLAEFLIRINEGANPKELINFCPVSGVVTLVGCELLCGIHRVTSAASAQRAPPPHAPAEPKPEGEADATPPDAEVKTEGKVQVTSLFTITNAQSSTEILRKYLLGGVAWRSLALLRALGVETLVVDYFKRGSNILWGVGAEGKGSGKRVTVTVPIPKIHVNGVTGSASYGLSCCRQLSSVLVWAFGEVRGAPSASRRAPPAPPRPPMHLLFSHRIWTKQKSFSSSGSKMNSPASSEKNTSINKSRHHKDSVESKYKRKTTRHSEHSSDSADSNDDLQLLSRSLTIKVSSAHDDFEYFNSPVRSPTEYTETLYTDPHHTPRKTKPKVNDYMTDKHKEIINSEITPFEFTLLIIDLLQELCKAESSLSGSEGSQISVQCINFSLRNLCSLQFGSVPAETQNVEEVSKIKVALTELLIVSLDKVLIHSDLCAKLINNGILPMLLRILEDVVCKSSVKYRKNDRSKDVEIPNKTESENLLKFVFGIAYSITAFFHCLLMQCRSVDKLREFTDQFKLYGECLKGGLLKDCVELMIRIPINGEEPVILIKKLIETIGKLVSGMKRVRSEVIHSAACPRSRHKPCRARVAAGMHHHHDILGDASSALPVASSCCISVLYGNLTALVTDEEVAAEPILRNKLLKVMLNSGVCCCFSPGTLMESIVRLMLTHNSVASLCLQLLEHTIYGELGASILLPKVTDQLPCHICEPSDDKKDYARKYCPHAVNPVERKSLWSFLIHYNSLLQLDNHNNVLHATVSHLLRVTPKCRMEMKYELLFSVIYPTFIVAKHRYILRMEDAAYFVTVSCLNIFASLLNTVAFAEQFIQKGGLSYVLELVSLSEFSNQCCSILEIAIIVEIFKLMKENSQLSYYKDISTLPSVQMLFKSLSEMTDKCYKIFKLYFLSEEFEELTDIQEEREILELVDKERKMSAPQPILTSYVMNENTIEESMEDHLGVLKDVCTFWKSCASLCLYSPAFRAHVACAGALPHSYALLKLLLRRVCRASAATDNHLLIKIMEALLTVQFAVSDVTSGRSKLASCKALRAALACAGAAGDGLAVRAVSEALLRVAAARPSARHTMPTVHHAKVPPLQCPLGSSSPECSSADDSPPPPYASDHSEPAMRPDAGYEADVEIGKIDMTSYKMSKLSESLSSLGNNIGAELTRAECGEYVRGAALAHPELCVVVVDVLTMLIQRLVKSQPSPAERAKLVSACSGVARACRARLAAAAAPEPLLLQRLLAPAVAELLTHADPKLEELQTSVLELVQVLMARGVPAAALAALLRLFGAERPPLRALLRSLLLLLPKRAKPAPAYLAFPADKATPDESPAPEQLPPHCAQADAFARNLQETHLAAGTSSPWALHALRLSAGAAAGWAPWLAGCSCLLHLAIQPDAEDEAESHPSEPPALAHLLSLGGDALLLEMWLELAKGLVRCRLSRPQRGGGGVLCEARAARALPTGTWFALAVDVQELVRNRRLLLQVTLYVDGCEWETLSLPFQGILVRKVSPFHVLLGSSARSSTGATLLVSRLALWRNSVLSRDTALHMLAADAPKHGWQMQCESPYCPPLMTEQQLDSDIDWDQAFSAPGWSLRALRAALLLSFAAHAPTHACLYADQAERQRPVTLLAAAWRSAPSVRPSSGLAPALLLLGGSSLLLYLYARVVELRGSAQEQAAALALALRGAMLHPALHRQLFAEPALDMLRNVLGAPGCHVSGHFLKAVLDAACSAPLLALTEADDGAKLTLLARADAALLEPRLLLLLMRAWRHLDPPNRQEVTWEVEGSGVQERGSVWTLALRCCCALLGDAQPRRRFNLRQADSVQLLGELLLACKERYLSADGAALEEAASAALVSAARALLQAPAPHALHALAAFLLLMHQAQDTFVTHSRANYYFLLATETPDKAQGAFTTRRSRRSRRKASVTSSEPVTSSSHTSTSSISSNADDVTRDDNRTDATKQMKGLINMQIKEGRKHVSSTSENSDTLVRADECAVGENKETDVGKTGQEIREDAREEDVDTAAEDKKSEDIADLEDIGEKPSDEVKEQIADSKEQIDEGAKEQTDKDLTDYIVVDVDEIKDTKDDTYTSGIYHQEAVRAGASPEWAACAGLLLLLRDAVRSMPVGSEPQWAGGALAPAALVVLAQHRAVPVRAAAVRALAAVLARQPDHKYQHCYLHLANQLSLYDVSWELASACATLLTLCDAPLEDQLDEEVWARWSPEWCVRAPPLLALLPSALAEPALAHNLMLVLRKVVDKCGLKALGEICVSEALVRAVRALGQLRRRAAEQDGLALLADDLHALLAALAVKALAGAHNAQTIIDLHLMLTHIEVVEDDAPDSAGLSVRAAAREAQLALFAAQLDALDERLHATYSAHTKYANYFTTVLSSAVSLGAEGASRAERGELCARHAATAARAVRFLLSLPPHLAPSSGHAALRDRLLATLLGAVGGNSGARRWWAGGAAEWLAPLQELVWWSLAPSQAARPLQPALLRALYAAPPHAMQLLAPADPASARKLAVYLLTTLKHVHLAAATGAGEGVEPPLTDWARAWALGLQAGLPERLPSELLLPEAHALLRKDLERWARLGQAQQQSKAAFAREALASKLTESAMSVTRGVVERQNEQRKAFLEQLRDSHARRARAARAWRRLVRDLTHEQGVFHEARSYPQSWQLDAHEGPGRVRVRLRRAHLRIDRRFLLPAHQHKAALARQPPPLHAVVRSMRGRCAARLRPHEAVLLATRVTHVGVARAQPAELLLTDSCLHLLPEHEPGEPGEHDEECEALRWPLAAVRGVCARRWCLVERAAELFVRQAPPQLLVFASPQARDAFLRALRSANLPPASLEPDTLQDAMAAWRSGAITNWEYLMRLNGLAGRSYNDLMQYPVLPFVLADYCSRILDLNDPASFRDLAKPMAVQNKSREQHYINTYNDLSVARREGCSPLVARQPHHYASLYSNSGGVLHYLVRLPPFTELFLNYQDNNFDMPDRTFHSLATTWRLITHDSPTDVKELIPELFYLPELFVNGEGLALGVRQCGQGVEAVTLPPWAATPRLFALQHRQALEAPAVTERLPLWIDLVFGCKQTGPAAVDALNVFPACTYYGFDPSALEDELDRTAAADMVRTYGQAPRQLLRQPHPHTLLDLRAPAPPHAPPVYAGVGGVRWGRYCAAARAARRGAAAPPPGAGRRRRRRLARAAAAALVGARRRRPARAAPPRRAARDARARARLRRDHASGHHGAGQRVPLPHLHRPRVGPAAGDAPAPRAARRHAARPARRRITKRKTTARTQLGHHGAVRVRACGHTRLRQRRWRHRAVGSARADVHPHAAEPRRLARDGAEHERRRGRRVQRARRRPPRRRAPRRRVRARRRPLRLAAARAHRQRRLRGQREGVRARDERVLLERGGGRERERGGGGRGVGRRAAVRGVGPAPAAHAAPAGAGRRARALLQQRRVRAVRLLRRRLGRGLGERAQRRAAEAAAAAGAALKLNVHIMEIAF